MSAKERWYKVGPDVSCLGFPKITLDNNHVDGPMLHTSECGSHWLTWGERIALRFNLTTIEKIDAKHRRDKYRFNIGDVVKHVKTGGLYVIEHLPNTTMIEATGDPAYVYRELGGFTRYIRTRELMEEITRFVLADREEISSIPI